MPKVIRLAEHPVGFCLEGALEGETVSVLSQEFSSSEDGNDFIARLEGISQIYYKAFTEPEVSPSQIASFLAVVKPDYETIFYINEIRLTAKAKIKRLQPEVVPGDPVYHDDIADIAAAELFDSEGQPISIPPDCGIALILSHGWRKGLYFDYSPLGSDKPPRVYDLNRLLGHILGRLMFQEMYSVTEAQWEHLTGWGWFPFVGLSHEDRKGLIGWAKNSRKPVSVLEEMAKRFLSDLDVRITAWAKYEHLKSRETFFRRAKERLDADDFVSSINVLYPQIEGVMRSLYVAETAEGRPSQGTMSSNLIDNQFEHSVLLPERFRQYLTRVYFKEFDERSGLLPLSRHTVSHGISKPEDYDFLAAAIGFMTIDQLFYYLSD